MEGWDNKLAQGHDCAPALVEAHKDGTAVVFTKALGVAVPGMPVGSPGMDGPEYGGRKDPYEVLLLTRQSMPSGVSTSIFTSYR